MLVGAERIRVVLQPKLDSHFFESMSRDLITAKRLLASLEETANETISSEMGFYRALKLSTVRIKLSFALISADTLQ